MPETVPEKQLKHVKNLHDIVDTHFQGEEQEKYLKLLSRVREVAPTDFHEADHILGEVAKAVNDIINKKL